MQTWNTDFRPHKESILDTIPINDFLVEYQSILKGPYSNFRVGNAARFSFPYIFVRLRFSLGKC
jgi:hypothetical protein